MKTNIFTLFLSLVASVGTAFASVTIGGIAYNLDERDLTAEVVYGNGNYKGSIIIPKSVQYSAKSYSVTAIHSNAFWHCTGVTSVTIPNSVTSIGGGAFSGCTGLTSITIPESIKGIGTSAFSDCSKLKSVTINSDDIVAEDYVLSGKGMGNIFGSQVTAYIIGESVKGIGNYAFSNCTKLQTITLGNSIARIGDYAFEGCSCLQTIVIPKSVMSVGRFAFMDCQKLTSVNIQGGSCSFVDGLQSIFKGCNSLAAINVIEPVYKLDQDGYYYGYFSIDGLLFFHSTNPWSERVALLFYPTTKKDRVYTVPDSVTCIGGFANNSYIQEVQLPNDWEAIGVGCFKECTNLRKVTVKDTYTTNTKWKQICSYAFENCTSLETVNIPHCNVIYDQAFTGCKNLTSITLPEGITEIKEYTFALCDKLSSVTIPDGVTSVHKTAFSSCPLTTVTLNARAIVEKDYTYSDKTATKTEMEIMFGSGVKTYIIGDSVRKIGTRAFQQCDSLQTVIIGDNVITIGGAAFTGQSDKRDSQHDYQPGNKISTIVMGKNVTDIGGSAFSFCKNLKTIEIPNGVTTLTSNVFWESGLDSIKIPNSVTNIGYKAFQGSKLKNVSIGKNVKKIGESAFESCSELTSMTCYCVHPPTCEERAFYLVKQENIPLYVPIESVEEYKNTVPWCAFKIVGSFATEIKASQLNVRNMEDNSVMIEWTKVENAVKYIIAIKKNGVLNCEFTFNDEGRLMSQYNIRNMTPAMLQNKGWRYTVTDLVPGNDYTCTMMATANDETIVFTDSVKFAIIETVYTISFVNWDNSNLQTIQVKKGEMPVYTGDIPTRPADDEYIYTFRGWNPTIVEATTNATYKATFEEVLRYKQITWRQDDGSIIDRTYVEHGELPTHSDPTKAADSQYTYTFLKWTPDIVAAIKDANYTATYEAHPNLDGLEHVWNRQNENQDIKIMHDGQLYILHGDKMYDGTGKEVK